VEDANESRITVTDPQPGSLTTEQHPRKGYFDSPEGEVHKRSPLNESVNRLQSVVGLDEFPSCISQSDISYHEEQHLCLRPEDVPPTQAKEPSIQIPPPTTITSIAPTKEKQEDLIDNWADLLRDSEPTSSRQIATVGSLIQGLSQQEADILKAKEQKQNKSLLGAFFSEDFPNQFPYEYGLANHSVEKGAQFVDNSPQPLLMDFRLDNSPEPALTEKPYEAPSVNLEKDEMNQQAENLGTKQTSNVILEGEQPNEGVKPNLPENEDQFF